jgi:hypothetical protein
MELHEEAQRGPTIRSFHDRLAFHLAVNDTFAKGTPSNYRLLSPE